MSKKKKTFEELLEEAILTEEEQPYEVPDNWIWVRTETTNSVVTGSTPAKKHSEYYGGDFPFVKPTDLEQGREVIHASEYLTDEGKAVSRIIPKESTMVCCIGSIGKAGFNTVECTTNQQINSLVPNKKMINPKFNYYQVLNGTYQNELWNRSSATTVSIINKGKMSLIPYVLPPLNEQKRIAEKVERLLCKIDEAKQLIEEANETFELRRAAILDKAFRGELTSEWRVTEKVNFEDWENVNLDEVAFAIDPQPSHRTPPISNDGVPYIGIKECNYQTLEIDFDNARSVSLSVLNEHINRYDINDGDFIIGKIGTVGNPFNIPVERKYVLSANVILIQPKVAKVVPRFLYYLFQSSQIEMQIKKGINSTTQAAFGIKKARKLNITLCSLKEQQKIVEMLDKIFENERKSKELIKKAGQFDHLKKMILQNAFRGDLGTNNPSEKNFNEL